MWSSLLRSRKDSRSETAPLLAALQRYRSRQTEDGHTVDDDHDEYPELGQYDGEDEDDDDDNGRRRSDGPLLPVFSEMLDRIPIYSTTHVIRTLVVQKCETTLSWDQLRSPQVSQFLVKPIQQQIRAQHFARGTLYCLIANTLQFRKEGDEHPGNMGVSKTRALICELLAMRLLKEFSTRELIDALSYDFDPLQGLAAPPSAGNATPGGGWIRQAPRSARISTLEVAIRAQAKKFLAHPLVVQQLEAIWAGTIVFHSAADSLHRTPPSEQSQERTSRYNTFDTDVSPGRGPSGRAAAGKQSQPQMRLQAQRSAGLRRMVILYDPHDASLFKLSRLRVPRYRNLFSTLSFAVMLGLFLAVLAEKSDDITALEVLFWFWSAGYMLDEIVGFSEQGFGLYIMSVWNAFDLGILLMFLVYYVLRLWGILISDEQRHHVARMAYDVLGATAVLLFPRLFSALDHYRYFSQLLIAFRMMALDMVAILLLIIISCSGFFVAFSLAFQKDFDAPNAAYALFQMLMGFTPAAWDLWDDFNPLGKSLLTLFLFICHFLIVTILITVLTNSFMAVVQNANEEHQFLFAVNTISMVKSDALFSYVPPTNIIGWLAIPLKYMMPFRKFVRLNRLFIKVTHIPILFTIFLYERLLLTNLTYGPTDLVEQRGRARRKMAGPAFSVVGGATELFSPGTRLREPSITTFRKDRALEEVFRRPFRDPSLQAGPNQIPRRNSSNVVTQWMKSMGNEEETFPPMEDTRSVLDRAEARIRPSLRRTKTAGQAQQRRRHPLATTRRIVSDMENDASPLERPIKEEEEPDMGNDDLPQQTDADGDDELLTNDEEERASPDGTTRRSNSTEQRQKENNRPQQDRNASEDEYFRTPMTVKPPTPAFASSFASSGEQTALSPSKKHARWKPGHNRNLSTNTVLFSPQEDMSETSQSVAPVRRPQTRGGVATGTSTPGRLANDGRRTPKRPTLSGAGPSRSRAILPPRDIPGRQAQNIAGLVTQDQRRRQPSFNAMALDLASDLGDNRAPNFANFGGLPASFSTQLEMAARVKAMQSNDEDSSRMSRIMLARMTTLEEGFRDVLKEVKGLRKGSEDGLPSRDGTAGTRSPPNELNRRKPKAKRRSGRRDDDAERMGSSL